MTVADHAVRERRPPGHTTSGRQPIDRLSSEDLVSLATDVGPAPMHVGAVLLLGGERPLDPATVVEAVGRRVATVPRLRRRLLRTAPLTGRPIWVDDHLFAVGRHVQTSDLRGTDDEALWNLVAEVVGRPLPVDRPLWRAAVLSLDAGRTAVVLVMHHVLADGIGGLAILANLVDDAAADGCDEDADATFPRPAPTTLQVAAESLRSRVRSLTGAPAGWRRLRDAVDELRMGGQPRPRATTLNAPTSGRRRFDVVRADLAAVRTVAHVDGVTVNDLVLIVVASAVRELLESRNESIDELVVSMPVSARSAASASELGNQVGAVLIAVPTSGDRHRRLRVVADRTRKAKSAPRGATAAVLGPLFRVLAALGRFRWFVERQRMVHTFVTNLRGPDEQLRFVGAPIEEVVALATIPGNVTVSFAVLSYAGVLRITVISDPVTCPDVEVLHTALQRELDECTASGSVER